MKRIIFDIDNTLIMWKEQYWDTISKTLMESNIECNDLVISSFKEAIRNYEKEYNIYNKDYMREMIESYINVDLPEDFIEKWCNHLKENAPTSIIEVENTLEYLYQKYELYALTNWFTESQCERLRKANLLKYFNKVIGTDQVIIKPNKESFLEAVYPYKVEDCIMIGDSVETDVKGAINAGIQAILIDKSGIYNTNDKFIVIRNIEELENIL